LGQAAARRLLSAYGMTDQNGGKDTAEVPAGWVDPAMAGCFMNVVAHPVSILNHGVLVGLSCLGDIF
jgi:hypothetical protein